MQAMHPRSKLQAWCEGIIEAGWLAALVVAPLFFNVYSSRVFEPDKIALVRSIALVMLMAYLVKLLDGGQPWLPGPGGPRAKAAESGPISLGRRLLALPFALPVLLMVLSYLISTALSVAPRVSWWGSYQRLQGTYTFLAYIVIAVLTAAHLRRPEQLRRLQHGVILTSLPISIYGIIQHYGIDPLPWGGDVVTRVSANAGNPIFLAAYLIMALFLTLERIYTSFAFLLAATPENPEDTSPALVAHELPSALAGGAYLFILIVQLLAIFWTGSRGPWLGLGAGLYVFVLLLITGLRPARYRTWTALWVGLGLLAAVLLLLINTTPLGNPVRAIPYVGRLAEILETDQGTGRVRVLIWEGVSRMVAPHEPIPFPDGSQDRVNLLRPLVGYGPEAMWVAYNNFYPPALAQVEARNASPDRAHNETWDSLAITGLFGFVAYVLLFLSIFYWALRWLGLIGGRRDLYLFLGLWLGGGTATSLIFRLYDGSWRLLGVALPLGFILGFIVYVTLAVYRHPEAQVAPEERPRHLLIVAILAAILAHYVEIHFGIAIAATRTYFWVLTALLWVVGTGLLTPEPFAAPVLGASTPTPSTPSPSEARGRRRRGRRPAPPSPERSSPRLPGLLPSTVMTDLWILATLAFLYTTNFQAQTSPWAILWNSLAVRTVNGQPVRSPGILFLVLFTWLVATVIGVSVAALRRPTRADLRWWATRVGAYGGLLLAGWFLYALVQALRLRPGAAGITLDDQLAHVAGHYNLYAWLLVLWLLGAGAVYAWPLLQQARVQLLGRPAASLSAGLVVAGSTFFLISSVNMGLVAADVFYKQGQQMEGQGDFVASIEMYRRALQVRPTEDHYMLFLGRSLLEQAKQAPAETPPQLPTTDLALKDVLALDVAQVSQMGQEDLLRAAEAVLLEAQRLNPLNTDHTANLARLYRTWADLVADPQERQALLERALEYYRTAVKLSPNAAHLWNELGATLVLLGREDQAEEAYRHSLSLDDRFENTYLLLAELYERQGETEKLKALLEQGLAQRPRSSQLQAFLGVVQAREGDLEDAIQTYRALVETQPNDLNSLRNLAVLYRDAGQPDEALTWAQRFLEVARQLGNDPPHVVLPVYRLMAEIYQQRGEMESLLQVYEAMAQIAPEEIPLLTDLAALYIQAERYGDAIPWLQKLMALDPDNYRYPLQMAQLYAQMGEYTAARSLAQQALEQAPPEEQASIRQFLAGLPE